MSRSYRYSSRNGRTSWGLDDALEILKQKHVMGRKDEGEIRKDKGESRKIKNEKNHSMVSKLFKYISQIYVFTSSKNLSIILIRLGGTQ